LKYIAFDCNDFNNRFFFLNLCSLMIQGVSSAYFGSPLTPSMRLPCYAEAMAVAYAEDSSHSSSAYSSPRQTYDPRVLRFIDQSASESEDEFIP
jgi:hypothetical protein